MIVGMLRVRNEARWIAEVLRSIATVCEKVYVFDDHSADATATIAARNGAIVYASPFVDKTDEVRDKNYLLDVIRANCTPDWILAIDGDEVLEEGGATKLVDAAANPYVASYSLQIRYLWNSPEFYRCDGVYGRFRRPSFFRFKSQQYKTLVFRGTSNGGNFHCGNVPFGVTGRGEDLPIALLHYGYIDRDMRVAKYRWYNRIDPGNKIEDGYRHIIQGDLPEVPADARLKWAGPLRLEYVKCAPVG